MYNSPAPAVLPLPAGKGDWLELRDQVQHGSGGVAGWPPRTRRRAPLEERIERRLEAVGLVDDQLLGRDGRVDGAVEHHGADMGREHLGVCRPEQRAVGLAEVGQLRIPERSPDPIKVPSAVNGPDEGKDARAVLLACGGIRLIRRPQRLLRRRGGRHRIRHRTEVIGPQLTGLLRSTPLGSNDTMSKSSSNPCGHHAELVGHVAHS